MIDRGSARIPAEADADRALGERGRDAEAEQILRRAVALDARHFYANYDLGRLLVRARRYDEAVAQCRRAMELDPGSISTHIVLRWCYEMKGMCEEALAVYEQERAFAGDTPTTRAKRTV